MSVAVPCVRMEIFRGPPKLMDDNFVKGWSFNAIGADGLTGYSFTTDGDIVTVNSGSGGLTNSWVQYVKAGSGSTDVYKKAIVRARRKTANGKWALIVHYTDGNDDGTGWKDNAEFEIVTVSLTAGKNIDYIYIHCLTTDGSAAEVEYDYVAICKDTMLVPIDETKSDIVESLTITLPLLHRGIGGFSCKLPNMNAEYTGEIHPFDHILIYLWRKGASMKKIFGGKILLPGTEGFGTSQKYYLLLGGMDIGQELLVPPALMQKIYENVNGKTIVEDAIDLCSEVTKKFVDVDNDIASEHDFGFDGVKSHTVITQVCVQAKTLGGLVGFDAYVDPPGNLHVFKRGKYTSNIDLTGKIEHYKREDDIHRVKNKIWVFGAREKKAPYDGDYWTENSLSPTDGVWTAGPNADISIDTTEKVIGSKSVKLNVTSAYQFGRANFTLNSDKRIDALHPRSYKSLSVQLKLETAYSGDVILRVEDSSSQVLLQVFTTKTDEWVCKEFPLGPENEGAWSPSVGNTQAFDWENIEKIVIICHFDGTGTGAFWIDGLHFNKCRFGVASPHQGCNIGIPVEDATSQAKYGIRSKEPVIDASLESDNECLKKAESLRDFLKDIVTSLSDFRVEGDNRFTPGDRQLVTIPNDETDEYFRILEVYHVVRGVQWDTILTLSNEPHMIDYVFADLHRELMRFGVSKGRGNPDFGGSAGERYQAASRVVAPVDYKG